MGPQLSSVETAGAWCLSGFGPLSFESCFVSGSCPAFHFHPGYRFLCLNTGLSFNKDFFSHPPPLLVASLSRLQTEEKGKPKASVQARAGFVTKENDPYGAVWGSSHLLLPHQTRMTSKGNSFPLRKSPGPGLTSAKLRIKQPGR